MTLPALSLRAFDVAVCRMCGGRTRPAFALCFCCATLVQQLQMPLAPVVAVVNYQIGDEMHRRLRGYKDAPVAEARDTYAAELAALLDPWMAANRARLHRRFGSSWNVVATVPSSRRPVGAPVDALVSRVPDLAQCHRGLLVRGSVATDHLNAARRGFEVAPAIDRQWLRRRNVLVFDDSIITGARAQSAVAALRITGAHVVGVVAVGRVVVVADPGRKSDVRDA